MNHDVLVFYFYDLVLVYDDSSDGVYLHLAMALYEGLLKLLVLPLDGHVVEVCDCVLLCQHLYFFERNRVNFLLNVIIQGAHNYQRLRGQSLHGLALV